MKIMNLQIALSGGGAEKVTELIGSELKLTEHTFERVACTGAGSNERNTFVLTERDSLFSRLLLAPFRLTKIINSSKPDVIHIHCERPEFTFVVASFLPSFPTKKHRPKVFVTEHTSRPWKQAPSLGSIVRKRLDRLNAQWYTCIEDDSTKTFIPNPVQPLKALPETHSPKRVFFIGRLVAGKRVDRIIDAVDGLSSRPDLLIIGDGPERGYLEDLARGNPKIYFTGSLSRPWEEIMKGDLYVSASEYEGSPLALLEALSLGVDVLASDIPAHRKLLPDDSLFDSQEDMRKKIAYKLSGGQELSPYGDKLSIEELVTARLPRHVAQLWVNEYKRAIRGFD